MKMLEEKGGEAWSAAREKVLEYENNDSYQSFLLQPITVSFRFELNQLRTGCTELSVEYV
jgi:hypothetical protein